MRTIKFRAWDKINNRMIEPGDLVFHEYTDVEDHFLNEDFIFMQYVGLNDKNGNEVYEGDKIIDDIGRLYFVLKQNCCFVAVNPDDHEDFYLLDYYDVEVIGNNPELLNE